MDELGGCTVEDLTTREKEVLVLVGEGCSYAQAAERLESRAPEHRDAALPPPISKRTVERYATQIRDKIGTPLPPLRALILYYARHKDELGRDGTWATGGLS